MICIISVEALYHKGRGTLLLLVLLYCYGYAIGFRYDIHWLFSLLVCFVFEFNNTVLKNFRAVTAPLLGYTLCFLLNHKVSIGACCDLRCPEAVHLCNKWNFCLCYI